MSGWGRREAGRTSPQPSAVRANLPGSIRQNGAGSYGREVVQNWPTTAPVRILITEVATAQSTSPSEQRFYVDDCVRSPLDGYGRVISGGTEPTVRWLDGRTCKISGETLTVVPGDEYDAVLENMIMWEDYSHRRVHGYALDASCFAALRRQKLDLVTRIQRTTSLPSASNAPGAEPGILWFISDDLNDPPAGADGDARPGDSRPIRVRVRRAPRLH
jgi:hypothetical protein